MSDYELKVGKKQTVNFGDIKEGIKKEEIAKEFWTIFDKIDTSGDEILQGTELDRFLGAIEDRAKRHNKKNLGFWEYRRVRKNLNKEENGQPAINLKGVKKKDLLAFINNLAHPNKSEVQQPVQKQQEQAVQEQAEKKQVQQPDAPKAAQPKVVQRPEQKKVKTKEGDTLESIAQQHGVSVEDLKRANPNLGDEVKVGDEVTIPTAEDIQGYRAEDKAKAEEERKAEEARKAAEEKAKTEAERQAAARRRGYTPPTPPTPKKQNNISPDFWKTGTKGKDWEYANILWKNGTTSTGIARTLYQKEGIKATEQQIRERAQEIERVYYKNFKDGKLVNSKPLGFRTTPAAANAWNGKANRVAATKLAYEFYQIADNYAAERSTGDMLTFLNKKINKNNIVDFLSAYNSPKVRRGDSSIIDTVMSEMSLSGTTAQNKKKITNKIFQTLVYAAGDAKIPKKEINQYVYAFNAGHRSGDVSKMENAMNGLLGLIKAAQSKVQVKGNERQSFASGYNKEVNNKENGLVASYNAARDKDAWYAEVGDKILWAVSFGSTKTTGDMAKELGAHAKEVRELQALAAQINPKNPKTIESFERKYEAIFHVKFNPKAVAAAEDTQMRLEEYNKNKVFLATANSMLKHIEKNGQMTHFLSGSDNASPQDYRTALYRVLKESLANKGIDINNATPEQLKKAINEFKQGINDVNKKLLDGRSETELETDLELLQQATYGTTNVGKAVAKFNENMMKTEMASEIALEIAATVALSYVPGAGEWAGAKLASSFAKWGSKANRMKKFYNGMARLGRGMQKTGNALNTIQKGKVIDTSVNAANKGKVYMRTANAVNKAGKYSYAGANAYAATAAVDLSGGKDWEYAHNKAKWMAFFASGGVVTGELAAKFGLSSEYLTGLIADAMNAGVFAGVTTIENMVNDESQQEAWVNALTAFILGRAGRHVAKGVAAMKGKSAPKPTEAPTEQKLLEGPNPQQKQLPHPDEVGGQKRRTFVVDEEGNAVVKDPNTPVEDATYTEIPTEKRTFVADENGNIKVEPKGAGKPKPAGESNPLGIKGEAITGDEAAAIRRDIRKIMDNANYSDAKKMGLLKDLNAKLRKYVGKKSVGMDHATELQNQIKDAMKKLKPQVTGEPKPTSEPEPVGTEKPLNTEFESLFEKSQFKRTTSQTPDRLGGQKRQQLEKEIDKMLEKASGEADLAKIEAGLKKIRTNPDWVEAMQKKVDARRAELKNPVNVDETSVSADEPKPTGEPNPASNSEEFVGHDNALAKNQQKAWEKYYNRPQISDSQMLQDYANFSKAGNKVRCDAIEKVLRKRGKVVVKDADGSFQLADKPSRFARIRQAASNFKTKVSNGVKNLVNKLRSGKSAMQKDTGIKPAGDKTIKELMDSYKKYANKNGYDLKVTPNADGTTTVDFVKDNGIRRQIKFGKDGKVIDDAVWVENKQGFYDGMHYDAKGNLQGFDTFIELSDGRGLSIEIRKGQEKVVVYEYAQGESFAEQKLMTPSEFQAKYGRTFPHSELLKNPAAEAPAPKPAEAQEPQGTVVNDGTGVPTKVRSLFDEYKALKKQGVQDSEPAMQNILKRLRNRGYAVSSNQLVEIHSSNLSVSQRVMKARAQAADRARQLFSRSPKTEVPKTDFEADTGIKPAGDRTVEELLPEWEAQAEARGLRLEHFEWNEGKTVTYEFLPKDFHVGRLSGNRTILVENGKVVSDRVPFENSKGGYDYKTYDAQGGMTKYEMTFEHNGNNVTITVDSDGVRYLDQPKNVIGGYGEATTWHAMYQKYGVELPYDFHDGSIIPVV